MKFNFKLPGKRPSSVQSITRKANGLGDMHFARDWAIGLCAAIILFLGGIGYIAFDFYDQLGGTAVEVEVVYDETAPRPIVYRDKEVVSYADEFNKKEARFNQLRGDPLPAPVATSTESIVDIEEAEEEAEASDSTAPTAD